MKLSLSKNLRFSKTWVVLGVALSIGVVAALVARSYLSSQVAQIQARNKGKMTEVVVAKTDLAQGAVMSTDNLAVRSVPEEYAQSTAVTPGQFERIDGRQISAGIKAGEMIMWSLVEGKHAPTFSARVSPGHRAITLPIDEINSISGMLEPGDAVDLMVTFDRKGKKVIAPLLLGVYVMATGQRSVDDPKSGERRQYSTVTLDTSPEEARNLIIAREVGKITALLRNPQDPPRGSREGINLAAIAQERDTLVDPNGAGVPVLYGGRSLSAADTNLARRVVPPEVIAALKTGAPGAASPPARLEAVVDTATGVAAAQPPVKHP